MIILWLFTVTPKNKRPPVARKRKLETAFSGNSPGFRDKGANQAHANSLVTLHTAGG